MPDDARVPPLSLHVSRNTLRPWHERRPCVLHPGAPLAHGTNVAGRARRHTSHSATRYSRRAPPTAVVTWNV
eukprot:3115994-Prymnesium_polylepis.1